MKTTRKIIDVVLCCRPQNSDDEGPHGHQFDVHDDVLEGDGLGVLLQNNEITRNGQRRYEPRQERLHLLEEDDKHSSLEGPMDVAYLSVEKTNKQDKTKKPKNTPGHNPKPSTSKTNNPNPHTPSPDNSTPPNENKTTIKCWNCSKPGHRFQNCEESRMKFCFKCGKKDVISPECPNCSGK